MLSKIVLATQQNNRKSSLLTMIRSAPLFLLLALLLLALGQAKAQSCATPGKDGAGTNLTGVINSYYAGRASVAAGAKSIPVNAISPNGSQTAVSAGDLLIVIQMQDATINTSNNSSYGANDATNSPGSGYTALNGTGLYEYVMATGPATGGATSTIPILGTGTGGGLINAYTITTGTNTVSQHTFQVVRVPQYTTASITSGLTCARWDGTAGGILAFDVALSLDLNSATISVTGRGFRGGAGRQLAGSGTGANTDYRTPATRTVNGSKGEGIAGTPRYVYDAVNVVAIDNGVEGFNNGSYGRGAPGNAGGGGTDGNTVANDENSGGGGGGNCGRGGKGGHSWNSNLDIGGFPGIGVPNTISRIIMGGGGGAGSTNNGTTESGQATNGISSSGAAGGGIVMIRCRNVMNTATIQANGADAFNVGNDAGGGGGAGGSILFAAANGTLTGLTLQAHGGKGGNAWASSAPGTNCPPDDGSTGGGSTNCNWHGPGGGGGGGLILTTSAVASFDISGGAHGTTTTTANVFGSASASSATNGCPGTISFTLGQVPGYGSGTQCANDVAITISDSPDPVRQGNTFVYTIVVTNNGFPTAGGVTVSDPLPAGVTYNSVSTTQGTCTQSGGTVSCSLGSINNGGTVTITITVTAGAPNIVADTATVSVSQSPITELDTTNNTATTNTTITFPTLVRLRQFDATRYANSRGVHLRWQSGFEVDNLGFNVYREINGQRVLLNRSMIAGSALLAGPGTRLAAGHTYSWIDDLDGNISAVRYYLEDIDLHGIRTTYGPFEVKLSKARQPKATRSILLSKLGGNGKLSSFVPELTPELAAELGISTDSELYPTNLPTNLPELEANAVTADQIRNQFYLASQPALKIVIHSTGLYHLTQADLAGAGFNISTDPRRWQLFVNGKQQPIIVAGQDDGHFDQNDYIEFFGQGQDALTSDAQVYWLVNGTLLGTRMAVSKLNGALSTAKSYPYTAELKERSIYFAALNNGDNDNFFGQVVTNSAVQQTIALQHLDITQTQSAVLEVSLQGVSDIQNQTTNHRVRVLLNGTAVMELFFTGQALKSQRIGVPMRQLKEGNNIVTLVAEAGDEDVSLVNYIRITYWHTFNADNNLLQFNGVGNQKIVVGGFTRPEIRVFDITDPNLVQEVTATATTANGYGVIITAPSIGPRKLLAITDDNINPTTELKLNQPSHWHDVNNASMVMITHSSFVNNLAPLKSLRQGQGLTVAVIDIEDLYDEFSFGVKNPQAIRDFLNQARTIWKPAPHFVLLVGDSTFDPRNYLGLGDFDLVPTKLVATTLLETASDDWFVDFNNDGLPDMAIGRLPARNTREADLMINKILSYETTPAGSWSSQVTLIADENTTYDFDGAINRLDNLLPANINSSKIARSQTDAATARDQLLASIESGKKIINYVGHGSVEVWASSIFSSVDAHNLNNGSRLPFLVSMECLNGFFHDLYTECLAEALLKADNGGAVAVWASSGLTEPADQTLINQELFKQIFTRPTTLGDATMNAKRVASDKDVRKTWILFGDPATKLK